MHILEKNIKTETHVNPIRVLYDMRNAFIHNTSWYHLTDENDSVLLHYIINNKGKGYTVRIRLNINDYIKIFFKALIRYFSLTGQVKQ